MPKLILVSLTLAKGDEQLGCEFALTGRRMCITGYGFDAVDSVS